MMAWIMHTMRRMNTLDMSKMTAVVLVIEYTSSAFDCGLFEKKVVRLNDAANNNTVVVVIKQLAVCHISFVHAAPRQAVCKWIKCHELAVELPVFHWCYDRVILTIGDLVVTIVFAF